MVYEEPKKGFPSAVRDRLYNFCDQYHLVYQPAYHSVVDRKEAEETCKGLLVPFDVNRHDTDKCQLIDIPDTHTYIYGLLLPSDPSNRLSSLFISTDVR